jgi:hypothetical protein
MTDHHLPDRDPDELDALASAHLDGATSAEEAAQVAADPALQARVEELRAVRDAVAAVPPVDPVRRDAAIAAALAAFAEGGAATTSPAPIAPVTSLAAVAARRRRSPSRALRLVGAAAAVVLLAALVPLLGKLGSSDDDRSETAARDVGAPTSDASEGGADAPLADGGATSTTAPAPAVAYGRFDELASLVAALEADATPDSQGAESFAPADASCAADRSATSSGASRVVVGTATVADDPVIVLTVTAADGTRSIRVLDARTCAVLFAREL